MPGENMWSWSETFVKFLDGVIRKPLPETATPWDWHRLERLGSWHRQIEAARELYRQGQGEALRALHDYWRIIAEDVQDQARFAAETYRQIPFRATA